jgi:hypothetical protein
MSLFRNKLWCVLCLLTTACGFTPVYGTAPSASCANSPIFAGINITASDGAITTSDTIINNNSHAPSVTRQFKENLEDLLAPMNNGKPPAYHLEVIISQTTSAIGISRDGTASRFNLNINSSYKLTNKSGDKLLDTGKISSITSYNNPSNQYFSTYISEQDARKRGIMELAQLYRLRLSVISENSTPPTEKPSTPVNYENCPQVN